MRDERLRDTGEVRGEWVLGRGEATPLPLYPLTFRFCTIAHEIHH